MIIWSGWGILIALIAGASLVGGAFADKALGAGALKGFGIPLAAFVAAALTYALARWLAKDEGRVLVDPKTGEQVVLRRGDSFFFIPVRFWTYVFLVMGVTMLVSQLLALAR